MSTTHANRATLAEPIDNFKDGVQKVGKAISGVAQQTADDVKKTGSQVFEQVYDHVYDGGEQHLKKLEKKVKAEPMKAILISAGIGALVGMLIRR